MRPRDETRCRILLPPEKFRLNFCIPQCLVQNDDEDHASCEFPEQKKVPLFCNPLFRRCGEAIPLSRASRVLHLFLFLSSFASRLQCPPPTITIAVPTEGSCHATAGNVAAKMVRPRSKARLHASQKRLIDGGRFFVTVFQP